MWRCYSISGDRMPFVLLGLLAASARRGWTGVAGLGFLALFSRDANWPAVSSLRSPGHGSVVCRDADHSTYARPAVSRRSSPALTTELGGSPDPDAGRLDIVPECLPAGAGAPEVLDYLGTLLLSGGWFGAGWRPSLLATWCPAWR